MNIRNPKRRTAKIIDCEIEHPKFGWIPFSANEEDPEERGREIYTRIVAGEAGPVTDEPLNPTFRDLSDLDNLQKAFKVMALVIADLSNKTPQEIKQLFKTKWSQIP